MALTSWDRNILITGGAGFIGSHVATMLGNRYESYRIVILDKLDYCASKENLQGAIGKSNFVFIEGDIGDEKLVRSIFADYSIDTILHFAAQSNVDSSFNNALEFTKDNVLGTHVLIKTAHDFRAKLFVHVSTDEVYGGNASDEYHDECSRLNPTNPYAASKAAAECIVLSYQQCFRLPVIITRANNIYGPHQYPEKIIPKFIVLLDRGKKCCIHGNGQTSRHFLYISDAVEAFDTILHRGTPGEIYNIGSDFCISVLELTKLLIAKMKGVSGEKAASYYELVPDRPFNDIRYNISMNKLVELGWQSRVSWEEGINRTIAWYCNVTNISRWQPSLDVALIPFPPVKALRERSLSYSESS